MGYCVLSSTKEHLLSLNCLSRALPHLCFDGLGTRLWLMGWLPQLQRLPFCAGPHWFLIRSVHVILTAGKVGLVVKRLCFVSFGCFCFVKEEVGMSGVGW